MNKKDNEKNENDDEPLIGYAIIVLLTIMVFVGGFISMVLKTLGLI